MASSLVGKQAVVIGAGMGGLAAAGALAGHFEQVVVLERDALSSEPAPRTGTPQARHAHGLMTSGQCALSELFPGFEQDLGQAGAVLLKAGLDARVERPGYDPFPQRDLGLVSYALSRPALEFAVRRRVETHANIELRRRCRVREIVATPDGSAIAGLRFETSEGSPETLSADLVVDASGRGAPTLELLQSIGRPLPEETTIGVDIGYSTGVFAIPDDAPTDWQAVFTFGQAPQDSRGALLYPMEGRCWMVSLGLRHQKTLPGDLDGFLALARTLRTPTIYQAIRHAKPVTDIARYGFPESVRRHFERLDFFPRGLLPIGDAICRFNPVYGQGMSVAAMEACLLRALLARSAAEPDPLAGLAPAFFAGIPALIETPWSVANLDFIFPDTRGERPADFDLTLRFGAALNRLAAEDPAVHTLIFEVQNLLKPRSVYREPELVARVMAEMARM